MNSLYHQDTHYYCAYLVKAHVIDSHKMGNISRLVNHSCDPNCEMEKWEVIKLPRLIIIASRNIVAHEELTLNYKFSSFNPATVQLCKSDSIKCCGLICNDIFKLANTAAWQPYVRLTTL